MATTPETGITALGTTTYGKSAIRMVKVDRSTARHVLHDLNVDIALTGDFSAAYEGDDNTQLLATDTMRNTVYALAKDHPLDSIEAFGLVLFRHFMETGPTVEHVRIAVTEYPWARITAGGSEHDHAFTRDAGERTAVVSGSADAFDISAGINDLLILKTTNSGWEKFYQDQYTVLPDTNDRILATMLTATWSYGAATDLDFTALWNGVRGQILETFTDHYSPSVQNTLYRMGKAVLEAFPAVQKIYFKLPNKHHLLFNLKQFGIENANEIFQVTVDPYGLIEGTVERK